MKTRLFILALLLQVSILGCFASDICVDGIYYDFDKSAQTATVTYRGSSWQHFSDEYSGTVVIPKTVKYSSTTYRVTSIGDHAFRLCRGLTSVTIPESVTSIGESAFTRCTGLTSVIIPESVTFLGDYAFSVCERLTSVTIPNSVTSIGKSVFINCYNLKSVTIDSGVTSIGSSMFNDCECLTSVTIPESVTSIGESAFYNCQRLTSVTIPNSVTSIGESAFYNCQRLTSVTIPNSVTSIGESAFSGCQSLTSVTIPESVTSIGQGAFSGCSGLESIVVEDGNTVYDSRNNCNAIIETASNTLIAGSKNTIIPERVVSIGSSAFSGCSGLTSVTIPESVTNIGQSAFSGCSGLNEVVIKPKIYDGFGVTDDITTYKWREEKWVWNKADNNWYILNNQNEYEPYGIYTTDKSTAYEGKLAIVDGQEWEYTDGIWQDLGTVTDTQVVEYIEKSASTMGAIDLGVPFKSNTRIQMKVYPTKANGGQILGDKSDSDSKDWRVFFSGSTLYYDFDSSRLLTSKSINTMYEWEIGNYYMKDINSSTNNIFNATAHSNFSNRTSNMLIGGGESDFERIYYIRIYEGEILVKDFVPYYNGIGFGLWDNVENKAYMPEGGSWTGYMMGSLEYSKYYVENGTPVFFGENLSIGDYAFYHCTGLTSITIPECVVSIGSYAFCGSGLTSVTIPESVTSIGNYAFGLTSVTINSNTIASKTYTSGSNLSSIFGGQVKSYTFGNNVTKIGAYACKGNASLATVTIGNGVTSIGSGAISSKKVIWLTNTPPEGYANATGTVNYVSNNQYSSLSNTKMYPYLSSMFEADGIKYVPVSPSERTCDAIDCNYDGSNEQVNIGTTVQYRGIAMKVKEVNPYTCWGNPHIKEVNITHEGNIGESAFATSAINGTLAVNNTGSIAAEAFKGSTGLTALEIGNNVTDINLEAFSGCTGSFTANINNTGSIAAEAFKGSTGLTALEIGNNVTDINSEAFSGCTGLTSVSLSNQGYIGESAFASSKINGTLAVNNTGNINASAFSGCTGSFTADINNMGSIAAEAFKNSGITALVIGNNVNSLGDNSFQGCSALQTASLGNNIASVGNYAFTDCSSLQSIEIPNSVNTIGVNAFQNCSKMTSAKIGTGITNMGAYTFAGCSTLADVEIGTNKSNATVIGEYAFSGCSSLPQITLPTSVANIGNYAFQGCTAMTEVVMEEKESELTLGSNGGSPLFADCPLESVYIGRNIAYPTASGSGYSPFYRNTSLRSVHITDKETEISDNEFYGCTNLQEVLIGNGVTAIGNWAFSGCSSLEEFSFGRGVQTIGKEAFSDCTAMTSLTSLAATPPVCGNQALDDINKWDCTLHVLEGYVAAYQAADQWKEFFFMDETDGIEGVEMSNVKQIMDNGIYDLNGRKLSQMQRGLNIVKMSDGSTRKVMVK